MPTSVFSRQYSITVIRVPFLGSAFQYLETFTHGEKIYSLNWADSEKGTRCLGAFVWTLRVPP